MKMIFCVFFQRIPTLKEVILLSAWPMRPPWFSSSSSWALISPSAVVMRSFKPLISAKLLAILAAFVAILVLLVSIAPSLALILPLKVVIVLLIVLMSLAFLLILPALVPISVAFFAAFSSTWVKRLSCPLIAFSFAAILPSAVETRVVKAVKLLDKVVTVPLKVF